MLRRFICILTFCALCAAAAADTVVLDGERHYNVYVAESSGQYQILFPETGEVRKVSAKRRDVQVTIDSDSSARDALKAAWQAKRDELAQEESGRTLPEPETRNLTASAGYFQDEYLRDLADFESALELWRTATRSQRSAVMSADAKRSIEAVEEKVEQAGNVASQRRVLDYRIADREAQKNRSVRVQEQGVKDAYEDPSLLFWEDVLNDELQRREQREQSGRDYVFYDYLAEGIENSYERERTRADHLAYQISEREREKRKALSKQISQLDKENKKLLSELTHAELTAQDRAYRANVTMDLQQRMEAAIKEGYQPRIPFVELDRMTSAGARRRVEVSTETPLWRVRWYLDPALAGSRQFRISIHDAATGNLITGATNNVPFYKRYLILKGPGEFEVRVNDVLDGTAFQVWIDMPALAASE
ncbi:MAG: hypothetical protein GC168_07600 [Candidatus Hydrogenedens sp.]|nr:hypothetical protein [Candidatus Hydrogenedens sp.]